jgi:SET domain-containing protein
MVDVVARGSAGEPRLPAGGGGVVHFEAPAVQCHAHAGASQGAFASRMSHSCTPNCQAVVMACGGRLTIAVYTLRHVHPGEELTFDYASVTESEREFRLGWFQGFFRS